MPWRGFFVGSLTLIVLYALLQDRAVGGIEAGGNVLVSGMRRFLSPDVAGIPQRRAQGAPPAEQPKLVRTGGPLG